jgi:hypothetical protein
MHARLWFYPEHVDISADDNYDSAVIVNSRFIAGAERNALDPDSQEDYEEKKLDTLWPSVRENIERLNRGW